MAEEHDIICAWCKKVIGSVVAESVSHGICLVCRAEELASLDRWLKLVGVRS